MTLLVEGFDGDAIALAGLLAAEGHPTTLAAPGAAPPDALALRSSGVEVREHVDLDVDLDAGEHDEAFLDVWTPEVAPRVARLRASGCRVRCLADLVLERTSVPTIGITGTAGKTTTAAFLVELLRKTGRRVAASTTARAGNLWPTAELLDVPDADVVVLELTSSHLCFTTHSPTVAVVTSFWPDHLELHGSLERYRAAKEAIVRGQSATDAAVVNADDEDAVAIGSLSPGRRLEFSQSREVEEGAFLRGTALVLRTPDGERELPLPPGLDHPRRRGAARRARGFGRRPLVARGDRAAPAAAVPHGHGRPARRYRARRRRDVGDADEDRRRASPAQGRIGRARRRG